MSRNSIGKQFMTGICFGIVVYYLFVPSLYDIRKHNRHDLGKIQSENRKEPVKEKELPKKMDDVEFSNLQFQDLNEDKHHHHDNSEVADVLRNNITVFCAIMARTVDLPKKSTAIHKTWAKRCTHVVYIAYNVTSSYEFPVIPDVSPERLTFYRERIKNVIGLIMQTYINECDWFLIATDETYVIMENLRYFLSDKDPTMPVLYGRVNPLKHVTFKKAGLSWQYNIANMGFVMSKEAVKRVSAIDYTEISCKSHVTGDAYQDLCMDVVGIIPGSTKDVDGREMFNCVPLEHLSTIYFPEHEEVGATGKVTVSDYAISFCMVNAPKQFGIEFHTYHLRAYGIQKLHVY
ncbi:glycoprotein-N-acetylgalactosamine 3-beta-galactosyltransferase 1-like [Pecten maximus]|uniref:glycoprotein-N-acetylgalactosamine 3-beta-galactosyltransferase 1-like n=1 Tax=Pecten maximus TaxID=6579 RepID=UPI001458C238|nr:glycoprotein-N-acetylgalactosamine 3-beta-galactosyltransferase 1-like [Pecten maximus]